MKRIKRLRIRGYGDNLALQRQFGVSRATVCSALAGHTRSDLAMRIREEALKLGAMKVKGNNNNTNK